MTSPDGKLVGGPSKHLDLLYSDNISLNQSAVKAWVRAYSPSDGLTRNELGFMSFSQFQSTRTHQPLNDNNQQQMRRLVGYSLIYTNNSYLALGYNTIQR